MWSTLPPLIRGMGKAFFSLQVERHAELPPPPFVIAANHYSHFDSPAVGAVIGMPVRYLALEDMFGVSRLLDWLAAYSGTIPTPRNRHPVGAVRTALAALHRGDIVALFPEATRVSHWGTLPPKRGAAWLAIRAGVPLVPVAVIGTGKVFGLENRLRRGPIRIVIGKALEPRSADDITLMNRWAEWLTSQIERFPNSEVVGPPRSTYDIHPAPGRVLD